MVFTVLHSPDNKGSVYLGSGSNIQDNSIFNIRENIYIGDRVTIGHNVIIDGKCRIDNNAVIGMGSILEENCIVEKNAFVGANSYVKTNTVVPKVKYTQVTQLNILEMLLNKKKSFLV